ALIMGAGDLIKPAAPNLVMLGPAFLYFASWYVLGLIGFWVFGYEPRGRTFEEIDETLDAPMRTAVAGSGLPRWFSAHIRWEGYRPRAPLPAILSLLHVHCIARAGGRTMGPTDMGIAASAPVACVRLDFTYARLQHRSM